MALPTLAQAVDWFEQSFEEVHVFNWDTHPPDVDANKCPNGERYVLLANGRLMNDEQIPIAPDEPTGVQEWFAAACGFAALLGRPKYLWWRIRPRWEPSPIGGGRVYSRLIMTNRGPCQTYRGVPIKRYGVPVASQPHALTEA